MTMTIGTHAHAPLSLPIVTAVGLVLPLAAHAQTATVTATGDRRGNCASIGTIKAHPSADDARGTRRWPSVGEHNLEGLSLPWRPLLR